MAESPLDFGELSQDENFKQRMLGFRKDVETASKMMETFFAKFNYDELSPGDKIRYNLFLAFAINSYFWMYLRIRGVDPNQHEIKGQINRVRDYMNKSKKVYERKTIMPRVDQAEKFVKICDLRNQDAAKRFVKSGLWMPQNLKSSDPHSADLNTEVPPKKKKKIDTK